MTCFVIRPSISSMVGAAEGIGGPWAMTLASAVSSSQGAAVRGRFLDDRERVAGVVPGRGIGLFSAS